MPAIPASSRRKEIPIGVIIIGSCHTSQLAVIGTGVRGAGATTLSICALPILFRSLLSPISSRAGAKGNCRLNCKERRGKKNKERHKHHKHLGRRRESSGVSGVCSKHPHFYMQFRSGEEKSPWVDIRPWTTFISS